MRTTRSIPIVLGLVALMTASVATVSAGGQPVVVQMTGAAERPGPGDPDGSGTAWFWINRGQDQICYVLEVSGVDDIIAAHIHLAPATDPGPVVVPLNAPVGGTSSGCADVADGFAKTLSKNLSDYYVNVHSVEFPGGAVRGQLG